MLKCYPGWVLRHSGIYGVFKCACTFFQDVCFVWTWVIYLFYFIIVAVQVKLKCVIIFVFPRNQTNSGCLESCHSTLTSRSHDGIKVLLWVGPSISSWSQIPRMCCCLLRLWRVLGTSWRATGRGYDVTLHTYAGCLTSIPEQTVYNL